MDPTQAYDIPATTGADPMTPDVLVVGAGPTGLTAACEAVRHGLTVRVIDRKPHRSTFSKALVVHSRSMEIFETMGVAGPILAAGTPFTALNVHTPRRRPVRLGLLDLPWGDTAHPFWLSVPQHTTERVLEEHLTAGGHRVEWGVELEQAHDDGRAVHVTLRHADGGYEVVRTPWLIGCDGGRSRTRKAAGLRLERSDAGATFVLADVMTTAALAEDEGHVHLAPEGLLLIVPMPERGRWRVIAHVPTTPEGEAAPPVDAAFLDDLIRRRSGLDFGSHGVTWTSRFRLSHGVADHYRRGRVFLAGDAAHVHSPVGGQGLNTGVQDAHNLMWKIAAAGRTGDATDGLLDSYESERRPVARAMVRGTARATGALTTRNGLLRALLGVVAPTALRRPSVQGRFGRGVGMLDIAYAGDGPGDGGERAPFAVGHRLPNPRTSDGARLHQRLAPDGFTWVVRGRAGEGHPGPGDPGWSGIPVVFLPEAPAPEGQPAVVLVRPDRHIAATGRTVASVLSARPTPVVRCATGSSPLRRPGR